MPVRVHVREQSEDFKRLGEQFGALWTPTLLEIDPDGVERHRIEGFLPADDLLAQLMLGLGHAAFKRQDWDEAARRFHDLAEQLPETDGAAEAEYWAGVARYKATGDPHFLEQTADLFAHRYQNTSWAKKASIWARHAA